MRTRALCQWFSWMDLAVLRHWLLWLVIVWGGSASAAPSQGGGPLISGALCGFLAPCTRVGEIGLHMAALGTLRMDRERSFVDIEGAARVSVTFLDLAEVGGVVAGHIGRDRDGTLYRWVAPATVFARVRLLPLPLPMLKLATFRLTAQWQHDFVTERFGGDLPGAVSRSTLSVSGGSSYGPVDVDGSVGFVLLPRQNEQPQLGGFQLSAALSVWLKRPQAEAPGDQFRVQAEGLTQFSQDGRVPTLTTALFGFLGMTHTGYGGGLSVGPERMGGQTGLRVSATMQFSWGPHVRNPWGEKRAAQAPLIPRVWMNTFHTDPILEADGCVYTDPFRDMERMQIACIGKPDPQDAKTIVHQDGRRFPVGTHLWIRSDRTLVTQRQEVVATLDPLTHLSAVTRQEDIESLRKKEKSGELAPGESACMRLQGTMFPEGADPGLVNVLFQGDENAGGFSQAWHELAKRKQCEGHEPTAGEVVSLLGGIKGRGPGRQPIAQPPKKPVPPSSAGQRPDAAEHMQPAHVPKSFALSSESRKHIFEGEINRHGEAKGWHHEPSGRRNKGTHVIEETRSELDSHGVYTAGVIVEGKQKNGFSTFFPQNWSQKRVESEIAHAYKNGVPVEPSSIEGYASNGIKIKLWLDRAGETITAYPLYGKGK